MSRERRCDFRLSKSTLVTQFIRGVPYAVSMLNLGRGGLYTVRPADHAPMHNGVVQLEIPVADAGRSIWAKGEVTFERRHGRGVGLGIRFAAMSEGDKTLLEDMLEVGRQQVLKKMMAQIRWRQQLVRYRSSFVAPPPPPVEHTVPRFVLPALAR